MPHTRSLIGAQGVDVRALVRLLPGLLPVARDLPQRPVRAQPPRDRPYPPPAATRRFDRCELAAGLAQRRRLRHDHIGKYLNGYGLRRRPTCRRAGPSGTAPWTSRPTRCGATRSTRTAAPHLRLAFDEDPRALPDRRLRDKARRLHQAPRAGASGRSSCRWRSSLPTTRSRAIRARHRPPGAAGAEGRGRARLRAAAARRRPSARPTSSDKPRAVRAHARRSTPGESASASCATRAARSRCSRSTRRSARSSPRCGAPASSTTRTSCSPRTTATCRASTTSQAARCSPTSLDRACPCCCAAPAFPPARVSGRAGRQHRPRADDRGRRRRRPPARPWTGARCSRSRATRACAARAPILHETAAPATLAIRDQDAGEDPPVQPVLSYRAVRTDAGSGSSTSDGAARALRPQTRPLRAALAAR